MDIKNAFFLGIFWKKSTWNNLRCLKGVGIQSYKLHKAIYRHKQSPKHGSMSIRFHYTKGNYSIFIRNSSFSHVILVVYVNDIILTDNDIKRIIEIKKHLHLALKILQNKKKIAYKEKSVTLSQHKYAFIYLKRLAS